MSYIYRYQMLSSSYSVVLSCDSRANDRHNDSLNFRHDLFEHFGTSIDWTVRCLTARSRKDTMPRNSSLELTNHSEIWQVPRKQRCRDACQISEQYNHYNIQSHGFETSRDLAVRRLTNKGPGAIRTSKYISLAFNALGYIFAHET